LLEKISNASAVKTEQSENTEKTSKNKRKKILKAGLGDVILKEPLTVKNPANKNQAYFSDIPRSLNSKTQNKKRIRIKYTKLYEITELPDKFSIPTYCTPKTPPNMDKIHINPRRESVDKLELVNNYTVLNKEKSIEFVGGANRLRNQPESRFSMCKNAIRIVFLRW
jgi:hypothetical protein